jgi:hypothetical protein
MANRRAFADKVMSQCRFWLSNEAPIVFSDIARSVGQPPRPGQFMLSVNGVPVAWTAPHGGSIDWIANDDWLSA